jgi:putative ABC transport system permease protein
MMAWRVLWSRLRGLFTGGARVDEEIHTHIAMLAAEYERQGMDFQEARFKARREFGGVEQTKELHREARSFVWIEQFGKDVLYGFRQLRRSPGFTMTAIAALALGIGANTAIFSIVNSVLLKPLPVPDPDRFVVLMTTDESDSGDSGDSPFASPANFVHWRAQTSVLQNVSAMRTGAMNYTGGEVVEQWQSAQVSEGAFRAFGLPVIQGRGFTSEEDLPNGARVAVISVGLWKRRFASDPGILGKKILLSGDPYTVVGVVEDSANMVNEMGSNQTPPLDVYVPFQIDPNSTNQDQTFFVVARLKPGVPLQQAQERLRASANDYRAKFPNTLGPKASFTVKPIRELGVADIRSLLFVLAAAVSLVLLIACANVANLLLVRVAGRKREIGIRMAVGAGRGRVVRQLLTESVLLSITGGAVGLMLGYSGIRALLASVNADDLPSAQDVSMDWRVAGFTLALSLATGIIFGLLPAMQGSRVDLNSVLKDSGGRWGTGLRQNKARAVLLISEVSLALVLLVGSALLIRTFVALYKVDRGFETKNIVTMRTSLTGPRYAKSAAAAATIREALENIRSLRGVISASATACCVPLDGGLGSTFDVVGRPLTDGPNTGGGGWSVVSPGYFDVFRIPVKRGRVFTDRDDAASPPVAVISESMAKEFWKGSDPLNDRIMIGKGVGKDDEDDRPRQIVGIVGDVRQSALDKVPGPRMYVPQSQLPDAIHAQLVRLAPTTWIVRTRANTDGLIKTIQEQLRQTTGLPVFEVHSMGEELSLSTRQQRFNMLLMTIFACAAMLLAAIGIYGLMAYTVEQRTQEIGIRLALGADATQLRNMVVRRGMSLALTGVVIGLGAAWGVSRVMESLLFGVKPRDPIVFIAVPLMLGAVALLSVWLPARRALRLDPAVALRHE